MERCSIASVIISSHNYGQFVGASIDSALGQTYPHTEVIVVDDGSTDDSRDVIRGYEHRVHALFKENGGQASALNAGFVMSRGEVVFFLDSDDKLLPTAVERAVEIFREPGVAKAHWPVQVINRRGELTEEIKSFNLPEGDLRDLVVRRGPHGYRWPPTSGNAWARATLERLLPIPEAEFTTCPDLFLALAPLFGLVRRIAEPQTLSRLHGQRNSGRDSFEERVAVGARRIARCLEALERHCRALGIPIDTQEWEQGYWWRQIQQTWRLIAEIVPPGSAFILVDEDTWAMDDVVAGRRHVPFMERKGRFCGWPPDDAAAIQEVERLRQAGADFMVFAWHCLWWLEHYTELNRHLQTNYRCLVENDQVALFDLRR